MYIIVFVAIQIIVQFNNVCSSEIRHHFTDFEIEALKIHNEFRARHEVLPLQLSREICSWAQEWANHLAENNIFEHRPKNKYGENLYSLWNSNLKPKLNVTTAVTSLYNEIRFYDYNNPIYSRATGHFTALIWKNTRKLGVAYALNPQTGKVYFVANYSPHPNVKGAFSENVLPLVHKTSPLVLYEEDYDFLSEFLKAVNGIRKQQSLHHLVLRRHISSEAMDYSYIWALGKQVSCKNHSTYGRNLFTSTKTDVKTIANDVIEEWYSSASLTSKEVKEFGIARVMNKNSRITYIVAYFNYESAQNSIEDFPKSACEWNAAIKNEINILFIITTVFILWIH